MDQLRAQLGNYLEWLEIRGLTGPVAFRTPLETSSMPEPTEAKAPGIVKSGSQQADMENPTVIPVTAPEASFLPSHRVAKDLETDARSAAALHSAAAPKTVVVDPPKPIAASTTDLHTTVQREAGMPWKVGFYSSSDLTEEEFIMVSKIALALGLPAEDFKIWAEDSLVHVPVDLLRCSYIVALGPGSGQTLLALGQTVAINTIQKALQGSPVLTIPHPRSMLKEPALKSAAWTALQKFKSLMTH